VRLFIAFILAIYLVGVGVALAPAIGAKWSTATASDLAASVRNYPMRSRGRREPTAVCAIRRRGPLSRRRIEQKPASGELRFQSLTLRPERPTQALGQIRVNAAALKSAPPR
jgi:hypothetical protein